MSNQIDLIQELKKGIESSFVDRSVESSSTYQPKLLTNNFKSGKKVLPFIEKELSTCDEFYISVAFITNSGITPLLQTLKELNQRGIKGKILTTDYLHFSEPDALKKLHMLSNIELRMYKTDTASEGFHTKGYIFKEKGLYKIIIGSSNLTQSALTTNREWNNFFTSTTNGLYTDEVLNQFEELWDSKYTKQYDEFITDYENVYSLYKEQRKRNELYKEKIIQNTYEIHRIEPNSMQLHFLENLKELRKAGETRALLISATGTGKTYASAFAIRDMKPQRVLFLVHREQIAKKSIESYQKTFGNSVTYGLLSGTSKQTNASFLFATRDTMGKSETLHSFDPTEFDVIIVDEVHRAGASTYQRIMDYFQPKFWLGMTATPERTDNFDIYKLFDHNIACEIRLQQALEDDLLCPFHYFGITDIFVDNEELTNEIELKDFNRLISEERVNHIISNIQYFGFSGNRVKGLVFVSRREEGKELSRLFNNKGFHTEFLSGEDSQEKRIETIDRLVSDNRSDKLDYIFSVDVFNEGIDIPEVNQIVMLRPTQSPIIFVQQLGRGLRKADDKEYVVILDFIGNYTNNYMIPIALSGDRSYNKDNMRRYVTDGARLIPGSSTIHFDEISRQRIYKSIDQAKTNEKRLLVDAYQQLKNKLGRVPTMFDFDEYESIDVMKFVAKYGSYYNFVHDAVKDKDYLYEFNEEENNIISYLSMKYMCGKKGQELFLLFLLLSDINKSVTYHDVLNEMGLVRDGNLFKYERQCVINNLNTAFLTEQDKKKYKYCELVEFDGNNIRFRKHFIALLHNPLFFKTVEDIVLFGLQRFDRDYKNYYKHTNLCLYRKYTYEESFRALNWDKDQNKQNIGGYFYESKTKVLPVYINYDKTEDAIAYEDRFISENELIALSKKPRRTDSSDADHIYKRTQADKDNRIYLFVRKNKDDNEAKEFYFLGEMTAIGLPEPVMVKDKNAFEIHYKLDQPVRDDIYDYIVSGDGL